MHDDENRNNKHTLLGSAFWDAENNIRKIKNNRISEKGLDTLMSSIEYYISELISESTRISKREKTDVISSDQIKRANYNIVKKKFSIFRKNIGTIGGLLLGASLSNLLSFLFVDNVSINSIIITVILSIIGSFFIASQMSDK